MRVIWALHYMLWCVIFRGAGMGNRDYYCYYLYTIYRLGQSSHVKLDGLCCCGGDTNNNNNVIDVGFLLLLRCGGDQIIKILVAGSWFLPSQINFSSHWMQNHRDRYIGGCLIDPSRRRVLIVVWLAGLTIFFFWCCWWWLLHPVSSLIIYYTGRVMRDLLYCESIDWLTHSLGHCVVGWIFFLLLLLHYKKVD